MWNGYKFKPTIRQKNDLKISGLPLSVEKRKITISKWKFLTDWIFSIFFPSSLSRVRLKQPAFMRCRRPTHHDFWTSFQLRWFSSTRCWLQYFSYTFSSHLSCSLVWWGWVRNLSLINFFSSRPFITKLFNLLFSPPPQLTLSHPFRWKLIMMTTIKNDKHPLRRARVCVVAQASPNWFIPYLIYDIIMINLSGCFFIVAAIVLNVRTFWVCFIFFALKLNSAIGVFSLYKEFGGVIDDSTDRVSWYVRYITSNNV